MLKNIFIGLFDSSQKKTYTIEEVKNLDNAIDENICAFSSIIWHSNNKINYNNSRC